MKSSKYKITSQYDAIETLIEELQEMDVKRERESTGSVKREEQRRVAAVGGKIWEDERD